MNKKREKNVKEELFLDIKLPKKVLLKQSSMHLRANARKFNFSN